MIISNLTGLLHSIKKLKPRRILNLIKRTPMLSATEHGCLFSLPLI